MAAIAPKTCNYRCPTTTIISVCRDQDVLFGRGRKYFRHPGNRRMLQIIQDSKERYNASSKKQKIHLANEILEQIRNVDGDAGHPARFLKPTQDESGFVEATRAQAHNKVTHALREHKTQTLREPCTVPVPASTGRGFQEIVSVSSTGGEEVKLQKDQEATGTGGSTFPALLASTRCTRRKRGNNGGQIVEGAAPAPLSSLRQSATSSRRTAHASSTNSTSTTRTAKKARKVSSSTTLGVMAPPPSSFVLCPHPTTALCPNNQDDRHATDTDQSATLNAVATTIPEMFNHGGDSNYVEEQLLQEAAALSIFLPSNNVNDVSDFETVPQTDLCDDKQQQRQHDRNDSTSAIAISLPTFSEPRHNWDGRKWQDSLLVEEALDVLLAGTGS